MSDVEDIIAKAIEKADSSYFFEDYSKQARAVMAALQKEGLVVTSRKPSEKQIEIGKAVVTSGRVKPSDLVTMIYAAMIAAK